MRKLFIFSIVYFIIQPSFSQDSNQGNLSSKSSIYFEALGTGLFYSINYDRIVFANDNLGISVRSGITYTPQSVAGANMIGIPIEMSVLLGEKKGKLELGLGFMPFYAFDEQIDSYLGLVTPRIGYRLQKSEGGFFLKTGFTPWIPISWDDSVEIEEGVYFVPMIGFAVGHTFKK